MLRAGIAPLGQPVIGLEVQDGIRQVLAKGCVLEPRPALLVVRHVGEVGCFDCSGD